MKRMLILLATTTLALSVVPPSPILRKPFIAGQSPLEAMDSHSSAHRASSPNRSGPNVASTQILSDVLPLTKKINIFAGFTRDIGGVSARLDSNELNTTVLAPLNSAVMDLPRKPWEDPRDYGALGAKAYEGAEGEDRAHRNLRRFVEAHVLPLSPWEEGVKVKSVGGGDLWWEEDDKGTRRVMPGGVEVVEVGHRVGNGEVWVLKETLNYA